MATENQPPCPMRFRNELARAYACPTKIRNIPFFCKRFFENPLRIGSGSDRQFLQLSFDSPYNVALRVVGKPCPLL